jgi:hypothetical protein
MGHGIDWHGSWGKGAFLNVSLRVAGKINDFQDEATT